MAKTQKETVSLLSDGEALVKAARQTGFGMEWEVSSVFHDAKFQTKKNTRSPITSTKDLEDISPRPEIDVMAYKASETDGSIYLAECKGAESNSVLMLFETDLTYGHFPRIYFHPKKVILNYQKEFISDKTNGPFYCYSGDFFNCTVKDGGFNYSLANSQNNKFFRGVTQLTEAIDSYHRFHYESIHSLLFKGPWLVTPLIITNARLVVARYCPDKVILTEPEIVEVPWAIYENPLVYGDKTNLGTKAWETEKELPQERRIPYCVVVQKNSLKSLLATPWGFEYKGLPLNYLS